MIKRFLLWLWCPGPCISEILKHGPLEKPAGYYTVTACKTCGKVSIDYKVFWYVSE